MHDGEEVLAAIRKTEAAEVRVVRKYVKSRLCVDLRIWWRPEGQAEFVPSRKGLTVDVGKAGILAEALRRA